jgi:hypothetical protein
VSFVLSPAERHNLLEAIDGLIAARKELLRLLIDHVNGGRTTNRGLDAPLIEVRRAFSKLSRYHPDAEWLPPEWRDPGEFRILATPPGETNALVKPKTEKEWKNHTINTMRECTTDVISDLERLRTEIERCAATQSASEPTSRRRTRKRPRTTIIYHGDRQYSIGKYDPIRLTDTEDMVLQAYLLSDPPLKAMDKPTLCKRSVEHAPRVLAKLRGKYDGRFAPAIDTPEGKKAAGGYRVRISRGEGDPRRPPSHT